MAENDQSTFPFFALPLELRNEIYSYAADWNDISVHIERFYDAVKDRKVHVPIRDVGYTKGNRLRSHWQDPKQFSRDERLRFARSIWIKFRAMSTPTVLLLNRQITAEAIEILHKKPLSIPARTSSWKNIEDMDCRKPCLFDFISIDTLKKVRVVELHFDVKKDVLNLYSCLSWEWLRHDRRGLDRQLKLKATSSLPVKEMPVFAEAVIHLQSLFPHPDGIAFEMDKDLTKAVREINDQRLRLQRETPGI
ncbi:MAG: hypothetical protein M1820_008310 [Bogoriella megaspora]|nr:MAG: hypothetical protein M1820_008310 [Bogoriella megaspora]